MKRILLLALPWMAMATVATGQVRQAHVTFTYFGNLKSPAYRVVDECFMPVSSLKEIGWSASVESGRAEITADGSHVNVPVRNIAGKEVIPLRRAVEELGGEATWDDREPERLSVVSILKSVSLVGGHLKVDATLNIKASIATEDNPTRIIVDIPGARLQKSGIYELDSKSRLGMYKPDQPRIVWENEELSEVPSALGPAHGIDLKLTPPREQDPSPLPPKRNTSAPDAVKPDLPTATPQSKTPTSDEGSDGQPRPGARVKLPIPLETPKNPNSSQGGATSNGGSASPVSPVKAVVPVGPPQLTVESADDLTLSMALAKPLPHTPRVSRPEPTVIEVTLPEADLKMSPDFKLDTASVTSVTTRKVAGNSILTLTLSRPMGAEVVTNGTMIQIHLLKPKVGNGKLAGKIIVIDPGHGGIDTGCYSPDKTLFEKDLTLPMGKKIAERLAEDGATVILTRKTDYLTPLSERPLIANRNAADFFISIHINSLSIDNKVSGTRTYYHGSNRIGQLLGECIQSEIVKVSGLPDKGVQSDMSMYKTGLAVLRGTQKSIPSVLIEVGFINHDVDRAAMVRPEFQEALSLAVERGLKVYLGDVKKN